MGHLPIGVFKFFGQIITWPMDWQMSSNESVSLFSYNTPLDLFYGVTSKKEYSKMQEEKFGQ
jgi:hypothetical protein